ncbi:MAG: NUDIX pyrophosphatase [Bdellovibrio sp.]|nr:NUDIX pyrophosphatase [Bdellovibrio sp.]
MTQPKGRSPKLKVQVWIYSSEPRPQILILQTQPDRGSFWQPVTGSVEKGESLASAALREAQEETGLSFSFPVVPIEEPEGKFQFESRWGDFIEETAFSLEVKAPKKIKLDAHEHTEYEWVSPEVALEKVKFDSNRKVLLALIRQLKSKSK